MARRAGRLLGGCGGCSGSAASGSLEMPHGRAVGPRHPQKDALPVALQLQLCWLAAEGSALLWVRGQRGGGMCGSAWRRRPLR